MAAIVVLLSAFFSLKILFLSILQLCVFPVLQQFGLLFAERLHMIGLSTTEITTIINLNPCLTSCMGVYFECVCAIATRKNCYGANA